MKKLQLPTTQLEEVLFYLITRIKIDRRQMMLSCGVLNLPDRISQLRHTHGLKVDLTEIKKTNKFGREIVYGQYSISNKKEAAKLYEKIQANSSTLKLKIELNHCPVCGKHTYEMFGFCSDDCKSAYFKK